MAIFFGTCLIGAAVLLYYWSLGAYRRRPLPRWTESELAGAALSLAILTLAAFGFGLFVKFFADPSYRFGAVAAVLVAAAAVAIVIAARSLRRRIPSDEAA